MNKEDNVILPKEHGPSILECDDKQFDEMPEKEFKIMIIGLLKNTEKQKHALKKSMYDKNKNSTGKWRC